MDDDNEVRDRATFYLNVLEQKQKALNAGYILNGKSLATRTFLGLLALPVALEQVCRPWAKTPPRLLMILWTNIVVSWIDITSEDPGSHGLNQSMEVAK